MTGNGKSTAFGGFGCKDVDECSDVTKCQFQKASGRNVDLQCINHDPGFECVCPKGQVHPDPYPENNHQHLEECIDLDECATGNHACPDNLICHNLYCEGDDFLGIPCEYGQSYVCACPYNPYSDGFTTGDPSSDPITSGTGSPYNVGFALEPTSGECAATGVKGWHKGNCGITNIHDANYATDVLITNLQADGHPDTGFGVGACPNFDQCADDVLHRINSLTAPTDASGPSYKIKKFNYLLDIIQSRRNFSRVFITEQSVSSS